jgi:hypothetical protein
MQVEVEDQKGVVANLHQAERNSDWIRDTHRTGGRIRGEDGDDEGPQDGGQ